MASKDAPGPAERDEWAAAGGAGAPADDMDHVDESDVSSYLSDPSLISNGSDMEANMELGW